MSDAILTEAQARNEEAPMRLEALQQTNYPKSTYQNPSANQARFTDPQADEILKGWICEHGTKQIREEYPDFSPKCLSYAASLFWRACERIEGRGDHPDIITITQELQERNLLEQAGGAAAVMVGHQTWAVVNSAIGKLRSLYQKREDARIGKELMEGTLTSDDALKQLNAAVEASRGKFTPIDNEVPTPVLTEEAFYGIAGHIVRKIEPESEAHPAALLVQLLVCMGNIMGRDPYFLTEADEQHTNLFTVIVGESSSGGKGTSWGRIRSILKHVDPVWFGTRMLKGMGSGEAFISLLKDDEGNTPKDKRLFVMEGEFATVLQVMGRQSSILGSILRDAWDSADLQNHCKDQSIRASAPHASLLAHITPTELREKLTRNDAANGFLNRILLVYSARTKSLPNGGKPLYWDEEIANLQGIKEFAQGICAMSRSHEAEEFWCGIYDELKENIPSGLWGEAVTRACPQIVRLSMIYALMDLSETVRVEHLRAAKAVWDYCHASARWALMECRYSLNAMKVLTALSAGGEKSRSEIQQQVFHNHLTKREWKSILIELKDLVHVRSETTGGRSKILLSLKSNQPVQPAI
jgi:hypothetical protein